MYLRGLLSAAERKNGRTLAEQAGDRAPDAMQRLLNHADDLRGASDEGQALLGGQLYDLEAQVQSADGGVLDPLDAACLGADIAPGRGSINSPTSSVTGPPCLARGPAWRRSLQASRPSGGRRPGRARRRAPVRPAPAW
jgi:hypothetical protein